ncbi:hypothetical protein Tco_0265369 [Tanacetum coccineum]
MEEYVQRETERALKNGKVYNWETTTYGKIMYDEEVHYLKKFKTEFPAIAYDDTFTSELQFSSEPMLSPHHVDEIVYVNDLKLDTDNDDDKIDIKQSSGDIFIEPSHDVIVIVEQRVKVNQKARILELKRRNHEEHGSDNLYAISIKEDIVYPCPKLHAASTKERSIRPNLLQEMDDLGINMEEYVPRETKRALKNGKVYNWETATYGKIGYDKDVQYLKILETKFPAIVYDDAFTSELQFLSEPTFSP